MRKMPPTYNIEFFKRAEFWHDRATIFYEISKNPGSTNRTPRQFLSSSKYYLLMAHGYMIYGVYEKHCL